MTCPGPTPDACTDQTPCDGCPVDTAYLAWHETQWANGDVGASSDKSIQHETPADLAEDRGLADHLVRGG